MSIVSDIAEGFMSGIVTPIIGWIRGAQHDTEEQSEGAMKQNIVTTSDNLATVQAELKAATDAPKTEAATIARLKGGTA